MTQDFLYFQMDIEDTSKGDWKNLVNISYNEQDRSVMMS